MTPHAFFRMEFRLLSTHTKHLLLGSPSFNVVLESAKGNEIALAAYNAVAEQVSALGMGKGIVVEGWESLIK